MTVLPARQTLSETQPAAAAPNPLTTILLPAYNEAAALPTVLAELFSVLGDGYEVIVVDDGSTDGTAAVAQAFPCRVIRHPENRGKGAAVRTGLAQARGENIVVMDADASYPASAIPRIVELLRTHDLVRCNRRRNTASMPPINRLGNWLFDRLLSFSHGLDGSDHLSGLYGLRRETLLRLKLESEGFDIEAEIGIKAHVRGLRVTSFPIEYQPRLGEKKLQPWRDGFLILGRIVVMFLLYNPLLTFVVPGVVLMVLMLGGAFLLGRTAIRTPFFGLDVHSFIIAILGGVASFQLIVFGMAAALYGVEAGYRPARWLLRISSRPIRLSGALLGMLAVIFAAVYIVALISRWLSEGAGLFYATREVVLAATMLVFGMQLLSAALFLSIFAGRLERWQQTPPRNGDRPPE
ncbi:MAG: glycosyltransferase [Anaerolineales bacterium]|nr:glycosyltransferase [Anaerolineales bacterium]